MATNTKKDEKSSGMPLAGINIEFRATEIGVDILVGMKCADAPGIVESIKTVTNQIRDILEKADIPNLIIENILKEEKSALGEKTQIAVDAPTTATLQ